MKLYHAGFGEIMFFVGANSQSEAIAKVQSERNMAYLPVIAREIIEEFGNEVVCIDPNAKIEEVKKVEEVTVTETPTKARKR